MGTREVRLFSADFSNVHGGLREKLRGGQMYSKEVIKRTLDVWQSMYDRLGVTLTDDDAREIIDNMKKFIQALIEAKRLKRESEVQKCGYRAKNT